MDLGNHQRSLTSHKKGQDVVYFLMEIHTTSMKGASPKLHLQSFDQSTSL